VQRLDRRPVVVALASVVIGIVLVIAKLVVGLLTGSLGILSEAAHSFLDLAASTFTLLAVRTARKPADKEHPYGHGRTENLAARRPDGLCLCAGGGDDRHRDRAGAGHAPGRNRHLQ
jgi:Co/Zn/Cd efflux system component